jgi:hypothetical protein
MGFKGKLYMVFVCDLSFYANVENFENENQAIIY